MKKLVIKIEELPIRVQKLDFSELERVFGGCLQDGDICGCGGDCCNNNCGGSMQSVASCGG